MYVCGGTQKYKKVVLPFITDKLKQSEENQHCSIFKSAEWIKIIWKFQMWWTGGHGYITTFYSVAQIPGLNRAVSLPWANVKVMNFTL